MKPNGIILYRGPSMIDGSPIVCIATGINRPSENPKTGPMVQTFILRADMHPQEAVSTGADAAICGGCIHRGNGADGTGRTCYVQVGQAPGSVYRALLAGSYPEVEAGAGSLLAGRVVRLGAYGDPAAVPVSVWEDALSQAAGWTGYTHQWRSARLRGVLRWCQASADTADDAARCHALGLGTFRVLPLGQDALLPGEFVCPASAEAGMTTTCRDCRACDGSGQRVAILAHGSGAARFTGERVRRALAVAR